MSQNKNLVKLIVVALLLNVAATVNTLRNSMDIKGKLLEQINELNQVNGEIKEDLSELRSKLTIYERLNVAGGRNAISVDSKRPSLYGNP